MLSIQSVLVGQTCIIEHIGSTSVQGLSAKPIIDIALGVEELAQADAFIEPLMRLGYEYVPKADFPNRRFFRKGEWRNGTHHLHVYEAGSEEWQNQLLFRDYLKAHPHTLSEYDKLKRELALLHPDDGSPIRGGRAVLFNPFFNWRGKLFHNLVSFVIYL
ncbi:GrpB protein [Paenibacillus catalpae]|uniref:GrpB protein n=1 Tax=Paenibacillus catalpae TaxID=1045775 RepID=A0A1I1VJY6_9BACL|nr:GrpB family protein [Paenibacillus catalpae]SFD83179.1 GrpB protein [Paenibacillus catalpae]